MTNLWNWKIRIFDVFVDNKYCVINSNTSCQPEIEFIGYMLQSVKRLHREEIISYYPFLKLYIVYKE